MAKSGVTTRGFKEPECELLGDLIAKILENPHDENSLASIKQQVLDLCSKFPVYQY